MSTWTNQKISQISNEKRIPYAPSLLEHLPSIELEHIQQQSLRLSGIGDSSEVASQKKRFKAGDVLYGSLRPYFRKVYRPKFDGVCSSDITVLSNNKNVDGGYLFYLVANRDFIEKAASASNGTKMPRAGWNIVKDFEFKVPNTITQKQIASVLSAYDDLIENNEKRIKVLEEMAERLYREWFVYFRFPGHEKVRMVDSGTNFGKIPEGWEVRRFVADIELAYGKALKEEDRIPGNVSVCGSGGIVGTHNKKLVTGPGIVVGRKGNAGAVFWVDNDFYPIDTAFYIKSKLSLEFTYYLVKHQNFVFGDAAVPGLNREQAYRNSILVPSKELEQSFTQFVEPLRKLIGKLRGEINSLSKTRDLLISQLVTGKRELK